MAKIKMVENGDKKTTVEFPITKKTMTFIAWILLTSYVGLGGSTAFLGFKKLPFLNAGENNFAAEMAMARENREMLDSNMDKIDGVVIKIDDICESQTENRRFMVALFKQIKALCQHQGVDILYEPTDFFNDGDD